MNIWKISFRNFQYKPLFTVLSVLVLSISIALLLGIQQMDTTFQKQLENNVGDVDMVVGAKGSPLQLVLSSVMHIDNPTGNINYDEAQKIAKNPLIKLAVPISYGDNYMGYRIVGTNNDFSSLYGAELEDGRVVEKPFEVVLGATVATQLNLNIGDSFLSSHGLAENSIDEHSEPLTVVGLYKPTGQVIDRLIISNLETIWLAHHHEEEGLEEEHTEEDGHEEGHAPEEDHKGEHSDHEAEITSLLVSFRGPVGLLSMPRNINTTTNLQAAIPKFEMDRLYQFTGIGVTTVTWIAYIILIISCITIFASIYRMIRERAFDLALLRTYGSNTFQLVKMVAYEGFLIVGIAFFFGILFSQTGLYFIFKMIAQQYKQHIPFEIPFQSVLQTGALVFFMVMLSIGLAIFPILKMNISKILSHEK